MLRRLIVNPSKLDTREKINELVDHVNTLSRVVLEMAPHNHMSQVMIEDLQRMRNFI